MNLKVDFVLIFEGKEKSEVERYLEGKLPDNCYIKNEGNQNLVVLHETTVNSLFYWMEQVIQTIESIDIQTLSENYSGSIMHIYIPVNNSNTAYSLDFKAEHFVKLWDLETVIDIDYGLCFKHE